MRAFNNYFHCDHFVGGQKRTHNKGFSAMLAAEYILIDISLISGSPSFTDITELWNIPSAFYLYPATVPD